ncbi:biotin transporter BioY [Porticoccaceae bacterium]|nr:biotin transporter BioY [Porticoccaceae bacterium]MDA8941632.1 biotin transporter BioY [Porticoccaceae bacterium]MDB2395294.1 biotin transporter BioY [Porticoccaceae bacterium]MDB2558273.1 biotin transporter BioY [Porticoccaceae bacterium]
MHINKDILIVGLGLLLICLGAMVSIDLPWKDGGIPITGQSLAVLVVGFVLGPKRGLLVIAIYLIAGLAGLPVFAKGASGIDTLMGGSGGFLYGFLVGGYVCGALQENGFGDSFTEGLIVMAIGTALILICGIAQLTFLYGLEKALEYGFWPFWPGALVKIILGAVIIYYIPKEQYLGQPG